MPTIDEQLQAQRDAIFQALQKNSDFFQSNPFAQALQTQISGRMSGADAPYTQSVLAGQFGQNADAGAGQFNNQRELLLRAFSNAGLGGSGLEANAMANAAQQANAQTRRNRIDIQSRADLNNFQARERAAAEAQSFLGMQAAHMQQATAQEVGTRSQIHATSDGTSPMGLGGAQQQAAPAKPEVNPFLRQLGMLAPPNPQQFMVPIGGFNAAPGAKEIGPGFSNALAQYQNKRDALQQQADAWEQQKAMLLASGGA